MSRRFVMVLCLTLAIVVMFLPATPQTPSKAQVELGKYPVIEVAHCGDCHTPMNEKGESVQDQWLKGAALTFKPISPMPWAEKSTNIAGLPGWKQDDAVAFFMTEKYQGQSPRLPMPEYHLTKADAEAVVAYLRSLGSTNH